MEHHQIQELLSVYYDQELNSEQNERVQIHLISCADCQKQLAAYSQIKKMISQSSVGSVSDQFVENVMLRIESNFDEQKLLNQKKIQWQEVLFRWGAPAVGVALMSLFVLFIFPEKNTEVSTESFLWAEASNDFTSKWMGVSSQPEKEEIYEFFFGGIMKFNWKQVLSSILIGVVLGTGLTFVGMRRCPRPFGEHSNPKNVLEKFSSKLNLDTKQKEQIALILDAQHQRLRVLRNEIHPKFEEVRMNARIEIRKTLNADQQIKFDEMNSRWEKRMKEHHFWKAN